MQFCLRVSNNVLHVFSLKFAFFLKYYVCEKHIFPRAFSGDRLLNEKQKKPFVSLSDEVTIIEHARFEFILPRHRFDTRSLNFFFRSVPLVL